MNHIQTSTSQYSILSLIWLPFPPLRLSLTYHPGLSKGFISSLTLHAELSAFLCTYMCFQSAVVNLYVGRADCNYMQIFDCIGNWVPQPLHFSRVNCVVHIHLPTIPSLPL